MFDSIPGVRAGVAACIALSRTIFATEEPRLFIRWLNANTVRSQHAAFDVKSMLTWF